MNCPVCGEEISLMLLTHPPQYQCGSCGHRWGPFFSKHQQGPLKPTPLFRRSYRQ